LRAAAGEAEVGLVILIRFIDRRSPSGMASTDRVSINWLISEVRAPRSGASACTVTVSVRSPSASWRSSGIVAPVVTVSPSRRCL
jgi:hypothetical protein